MRRILMNNGVEIQEVRNPAGGLSYYASAGPEGQVLVWDTAMNPLPILQFCVALYLDPELKSGPEPHLKFNPTGFRL